MFGLSILSRLLRFFSLLGGFFGAQLQYFIGAFAVLCLVIFCAQTAGFHLKDRRGAVLTSPSRDGAVLAAAMACFGVSSVRGSSSKRGAVAMREMAEWIGRGYDMVFTPDGPRGPRYRLAAGPIRLAQKTGAPIFPIRVEYVSAWVFHRSWDRFRVPKPFSRVRVIFEPYETIDAAAEGDRFEEERGRIERVMNPEYETD